MNNSMLAFFGLPGGVEWVVIALIALLVFGRRLPDVARSVGKSIVEFKKGIKDVKEDIEVQARLEPPKNSRIEAQASAGTATGPVSEPAQSSAPNSAASPVQESSTRE